MHGYVIIQELENRNLYKGEKFDNAGIYRTLKNLEEKALVSSEWEFDGTAAAKKIYKINSSGKECLKNWIQTLEDYKKTIDVIIEGAYLTAQVFGAFFAGLVLYILFDPSIITFETVHHIIRGTANSVQTAKIFGEYYQHSASHPVVSMPLAMGAEGFGTFLLVLMIFSLTEGCNLGRPDNNLSPIFIGLSVTSIICLIAPLTQAGLNPARDFGPRLVAWIFGWGAAAFPDQSGGFFFVYILAPLIGGQAASLLFTRVLEPLMNRPNEQCCCNNDSTFK